MLKIKVVTDSSADISLEEEKELGIDVVRLPISIDEKDFLEAVDITRDDFIKRMRDGATVKTSQPTMGELKRVWDKALSEADEIIYVPISSELSGSYTNACMFANSMYPGKVTILDLKHVCYPLAQICQEIQKCVENELSALEIKELFETQSNLWAIIIPDDIVYLRRGGRISAAAAAIANLLKIYPILKVEGGAIDLYDKVRTAKKAYRVGIDAVFEGIENPEDYYFTIVEADAKELALKYKEEIKEKYNVDVNIVPMHPIIMSHTGPGTFCIGRYRKVFKG